MSLRLEMLQVARLAKQQLGDSSQLVVDYLNSLRNDDGGFQDRVGDSDLYYAVFALEGLMILDDDMSPPLTRSYLESFGDGHGLDFIHVGCLASCWATLAKSAVGDTPLATRRAIADRIESHRSHDGGYHIEPDSQFGSAYGCFVAVGAYQDLGLELPNPDDIRSCVERLQLEDGSFANDPDLPIGLTPPTAAAVVLHRHLGMQTTTSTKQWLMDRCYAEGGFFASTDAPVPDLLSMATALHALSILKADISAIKEPCLDFLDTLWTPRGGFLGNWTDDDLDCEYTFYGLLSLGHLSI